MDSHSRSASPREQPRPQQRPPSPPSPRLPPAAFDNKAYQHDDADPNHNESFTSNGAQQNGHNKELNGESKSPEAVNLELINLTPKNGSLKQKKDVEVDMNGSNPYDEYFVPVNEHRKYMRGEKLYVTADKRGEKGGCKRPLCWTLLALVVAAIIALIALAATGVIFSNSPTPVDPYNASISSARALPGIGQSLNNHVLEHDQDQHDQHQEHDQNTEQNQEQGNHTNDENQEQANSIHDHDQHDHSTDQNQEQPDFVHEEEQNEQNNDENQPQQGRSDLDQEQHEPVFEQDHEHDQSNDQDQGQHNQSLDQDHEQNDQSQDQGINRDQETPDDNQNSDQHDQMHQQNNPEVHMPETQNDEGRAYAINPGVNDMSMYVPRTVEGELKIDNEQFLEAYNDPESDEYRQFTESFKEALMRALFDRNTLESNDNDINLEVIQLRPGSVVVTYRINWKPKHEDRFTEDLLNATTLQEKMNNYLINNNRMVSIYHVDEDSLATRLVLDLCQINKNECQEGCEFDETSLDFICTCPQGLILDMSNLKTCVPYLPYPASKPIQETLNEVNKPILITTTAQPVNRQLFENNSGIGEKGIEAEATTIEADSDLKFSSPFDEHIKNKSDLETTMDHQKNDKSETTTKQSPDIKMSVITESEDRVQPAPEMNSTIALVDTQNTTNFETYSKEGSMFVPPEGKVELIPSTMKPELENKDENITGQHIFSQLDFNPNNVTETNTDLKTNEYGTPASSYDSEPEVQEGHYSDSGLSLDEALGSHQVIKPEEVYTEQPESSLPPSEENDSKEMSHSIIEPEPNVMSESNETLVSSEISNPSITLESSDPHESAEIMSVQNNETSPTTTTTVNPITIQHDFNAIKDLSHEPNLEEISHVMTGSGKTNIDANNNKTETNTDDMDDWLSDTLPSDNNTLIATTIENSERNTFFSNHNLTESENETESRSFKNFDNGPEGTTIPTNSNELDTNRVLNILSTENNTTKEKGVETKEENPSADATMHDVEIGRSVLYKIDPVVENKNDTIFNDEKKHVDHDIPPMISESKVPMLYDTNLSEQEITTEQPENSSQITNSMPQDFFKSMDTLNEPQINKTLTNTNSSDDTKYVTFNDINMLLNRSSKSMDNLTQNIDSGELLETTNNKTSELGNSPLKQNDSEWISEPVTEVKYNERVNTMDKTETTESVKNKVDHIMTHAKDDYEPDYLSKADDSMYMMERDYESDDPRVKRVNTENKYVTSTELPKNKNSETNLISNEANTTTSEPISLPTVVISEVTSTTSAPSTTVSEFIYNAAEKHMNFTNETSDDNTTFLQTSPVVTTESIPILTELDNESNSKTILLSSNETGLGPMNTNTSTVFAPHAENNEILNNTEVSNSNKQNETQVSNLDVTIYEISHHTGNHSLPVSKSANAQMSEYEDHETEMNPFLPETENNKNLVKKLQEGHDLELTNMNETQNDNSDEHNFNNTEGHMINNIVFNETSISPYVNELVNRTTTAEDKTSSETQGDNRTNVEKSSLSEISDSNKVTKEENDNNSVETGQEVLPISTFLIDTDDLDANKISSSSNSFTDSPLSRFRLSNNENLNVVPITGDIEEGNAHLKNSKIQSRNDLNDISDTSKNSEKRTFELANFDHFTNNES